MSNWRPSNVDEEVLAAFAKKGLLPSKEVAHWRAPTLGEVVPQPRANKVISLLAFHERGLGYPMHWFLCGLLNEWGLELQHLNPTRVLHITDFITVCEAFLEMEPHVDLFRWIFSGWALSEWKLPRIALVGRFTLLKQPKPSVPYPAYLPSDSNQGWHDEWFFIRNPAEVPFPTFTW